MPHFWEQMNAFRSFQPLMLPRHMLQWSFIVLTKSVVDSVISETLCDSHRRSPVCLVDKFSVVPGTNGIFLARNVQHTTNTGDAWPLRQRPYRISRRFSPEERRFHTLLRTLPAFKYSCEKVWFGHWQMQIADRDKEKTVLVNLYCLFEFNVMPFGLSNRPKTF